MPDFMETIRSGALADVPHRDIEHGYSQHIRDTAEELIGRGLDPTAAARAVLTAACAVADDNLPADTDWALFIRAELRAIVGREERHKLIDGDVALTMATNTGGEDRRAKPMPSGPVGRPLSEQ